MEWHVFRNINNFEKNDTVLIDCQLKSGILKIAVIEKSVARSVEIHPDEIGDYAKKLEMNSQDYLRGLNKYLKSDSSEFKFHKNEFVLQYNLSTQYKVKYFQCKLVKVESITECAGDLLQRMYKEKNKATEQMYLLREETKNLKKSTTSLEHKLNEFIERKKRDEEILFSNFVLILNEKKMRIQHLTELLEAFRHGRPTVNSPPCIAENTKNSRKYKVEIKNEISESEAEESEVDYNTDNDKSTSNERLSENMNEKKENEDFSDILDESKPGTSKDYSPRTSRNFISSLLDDSPPEYSLPKRTKYLDKIDNTLNPPQNTDLSKDLKETKIEMEDSVSSRDSFDTQDLLNDL